VTLSLKPGTSWDEVYARARSAAPEAFDADRILNLAGGEWQRIGTPGQHVTPVDGQLVPGPPRIEHDDAVTAVKQAAAEHRRWSTVDLDERKVKVAAAVAAMRRHRDTLALLLVWEIGKPWRLACADVDRALSGVDWYLGEIERQLVGRTALPGPVSNIASWNYPMSVQVHSELVQLLAGNAVVAKTPSQGGFHTLTLAHALMRREGLPVSLLSGVGSKLGDALISAPEIGALAFVGGRTNGRKAATTLADTGKRHMLEQEGLNAWGVWDFSQWDLLAGHLKKGFEYAKQRCTAYPRYVVQRELFPEFLQAYLPVVDALRWATRWRSRHRMKTCPSSTSARSSTPPRPPSCASAMPRPSPAGASRCATGPCPTARSWTARTPARTSRRPASWSRRRRGPCGTPSRSGRSTPSCWWTPRPSCWRR